MSLISLEHVSKIYPKGTRPALDDISLDVNRGDFVFLVGASGSGKTTLLSLLLREEEATKGEIHVAGNDLRRLVNRQVPQYRRTLGFIFQDYKLLNNKTVYQNVAFALEVIGTSRSTIKSLVPRVLETVGLTGKENNYPHELSGGEAQRVAIARAYVNHPQILLADEPTGNLDPTTSLGIMEVLDAINRTGTTIVMATHNEEIVNSMRKRVVELHAGKLCETSVKALMILRFTSQTQMLSKSRKLSRQLKVIQVFVLWQILALITLVLTRLLKILKITDSCLNAQSVQLKQSRLWMLLRKLCKMVLKIMRVLLDLRNLFIQAERVDMVKFFSL